MGNRFPLVTHYVHLMEHKGEGFTEGMVPRGSLERLSPVLLTALTAGLRLIPLVAAGQPPGVAGRPTACDCGLRRSSGCG